MHILTYFFGLNVCNKGAGDCWLGGESWMNWCLYAAVIVSFLLLLKFREEYKRLAVDKGRVATPLSIEVSAEHTPENITASPAI